MKIIMEIIDNNLILNFGNDTRKRAVKDSQPSAYCKDFILATFLNNFPNLLHELKVIMFLICFCERIIVS